jgi:hypothetical protein
MGGGKGSGLRVGLPAAVVGRNAEAAQDAAGS